MLQIIATLLGDTITPILDRQVEDFIRRVDEDLDDLIWNAETCGLMGVAPMTNAYHALDRATRERLALSPGFFAALRDARGNLSEDAFAAMAEAMRGSPPQADPAPSERSQAMIIGDTIRLELRTPQARRIDPTSPVFCGAFEDPDAAETKRIVDKIGCALAEIDDIAPTFGRLIRNYTRVIYVRKIAGRSPASEQVDSELGSIRLRNVHDDSYGHLQLMDDLIHESVHNFLGTFEYLRFPFLTFGGRNDRASARPVSPWSFRPIQMLPFLHAAFVYFAIWNYAKLRRSAFAPNSDEGRAALRQYNRYASGFLMSGRLSQCAMGQADIDPRVLAALDWMQEFVRREAGAATIAPFPTAISPTDVSQETIDEHPISQAA